MPSGFRLVISHDKGTHRRKCSAVGPFRCDFLFLLAANLVESGQVWYTVSAADSFAVEGGELHWRSS